MRTVVRIAAVLGLALAVMVMPGAFGHYTTLHMFQWVKEKGYLGEQPFQKYHARKLAEAKSQDK